MVDLLIEIQKNPIIYKGKPVITLSMVDKLHKRPTGTAKRTFRSHKRRLSEGSDYWVLSKDAIRPLNKLGFIPPRARSGIVLSEKGYLKLVKPFQDDLSWSIQDKLIDSYFRVKNQGIGMAVAGMIMEESGKMLQTMAGTVKQQNEAMAEMASSAARIMSLKRWYSTPNPDQQSLPFSEELRKLIGGGDQ